MSEGPPSHSRPLRIGTPRLASWLASPPALAAEPLGPVSVPLLGVVWIPESLSPFWAVSVGCESCPGPARGGCTHRGRLPQRSDSLRPSDSVLFTHSCTFALVLKKDLCSQSKHPREPGRKSQRKKGKRFFKTNKAREGTSVALCKFWKPQRFWNGVGRVPLSLCAWCQV